MDSLSLTMNALALAASLAALGISSLLTLRQARLARQANQLPVIIDLLRECRDPDFVRDEQSLWHALGTLDPELGFAELPEPTRTHANAVCSYYATFAYLVAIGSVAKEVAVLPIHYRLRRTWNAVLPFVHAERERRGGELTFLNMLEDFVHDIEHTDIPQLVATVRRRTHWTAP